MRTGLVPGTDIGTGTDHIGVAYSDSSSSSSSSLLLASSS